VGHAYGGLLEGRPEALLALLQLLLRPLALGDVPDEPGEEALAVLDELTEGDLKGDLLAALVFSGELYGLPVQAPPTGIEVASQRLPVIVPQTSGHQHGQFPSQHLLPGVSEYSFGGAVDEQDLAAFVDHDDDVGSGLRDDAVTFLTLPERLLDALLPGDVELDAPCQYMGRPPSSRTSTA